MANGCLALLYALLMLLETAKSLVYNRYNSLTNYMNCSAATSNDICNLYCDKSLAPYNPQFVYDCGEAGECNFYCTVNKCSIGNSIIGVNAKQLNVTSTFHECMLGTKIYAPNNGSVYATSNTANVGFNAINIFAGTNTDQIIMNCIGGGGCRRTNIIDAINANYLKITVG
eukprot:165991_1